MKNQALRRAGRSGSLRGIALLMVVSIIAILGLVLIEFSSSARTHLNAGINVRDDVRATTTAETALVMTRACLDQTAWGPLAGQMRNMNMERLCDLMLGIFVRGRVDFPIGGLSMELQGIEGVGLASGDVEDMQLTSEESYIGLAGLYCPGRAQANCSNRLSTMRLLMSELCNPQIAHVFEKEQADGKRYTREEVVGNLIDWVDADDNRIYIDPATWSVSEGVGEGEDAYLREGGVRYRSKDAPFDSIEELRLVRGVNDDLFDFLKDKISVHSAGRVDVNSASAGVIASLLRASAPGFGGSSEAAACGVETEAPAMAGGEAVQDWYSVYAQLIVEARTAKQGFFISKPFKNKKDFVKVAQNPAAAYVEAMGRIMGQQLTEADYIDLRLGQLGPFFRQQVLPLFLSGQLVQWDVLERAVRTDNNLYRLRVRGTVGNMTRQLFAVLRLEGKTVRTLYYREE
ncbi:MAG: type II secretion system protein GspK [bacterium]